MVERGDESVPPVELGGPLVDRIHDDESGRDRVTRRERHPEGVGQQACAETSALLILIGRQPGDEDYADRVGRNAPNQPARRLRTPSARLRAAVRQAGVPDSAEHGFGRVVPADAVGERKVVRTDGEPGNRPN